LTAPTSRPTEGGPWTTSRGGVTPTRGSAEGGEASSSGTGTVCCADSELPIAYTVAPCNENDKLYFEPLLEEARGLGVGPKVVVADSQYSSENVRNAAEWLGAEPIIPVRRDSRMRRALRVGRDFVAKGSRRVVRLFRKRWSIERLFGRVKNWLMLDGLRVRGLAEVCIHVSLSLIDAGRCCDGGEAWVVPSGEVYQAVR
jgi:hypothetical protein